MPIPKPDKPNDIHIDGQPAERLVKVVKPYKVDIPDIHLRMVELAEKAKAPKEEVELAEKAKAPKESS